MEWLGTTTTDIVMVTERENHEPIRALTRQVQQLGYNLHSIPHVNYEHTTNLPTPQVVLIDATAQDARGLSTIQSAIRSTWEGAPIILMARSQEIAHIHLDPKLQDFLVLPTTLPEFEARIRFALWKNQKTLAPHDELQLSGLRINLSTYEVWVNHHKIALTYKEFELLKFLVTHQHRVFSRPELLELVWENDYYGGTRTVDVHVRRLREKLGPVVGSMIHTVRNVGYRFG